MIAPEIPLLIRALAMRLMPQPTEPLILLVVPSVWEIEVNVGHVEAHGRNGVPIPVDGSIVWRDRMLMGWAFESTHGLAPHVAIALRLALVRALAELPPAEVPCEGQ